MNQLQRKQLDEFTVVNGATAFMLVFNGHCWHTGAQNETEGYRRSILIHCLRADHPRPDNVH
jgi:hypothetical protein